MADPALTLSLTSNELTIRSHPGWTSPMEIILRPEDLSAEDLTRLKRWIERAETNRRNEE